MLAELTQTEEITDPVSPPRSMRLLQFGILAVPVIIFVWASWQVRLFYDDGYIYTHVLQQVIAGNGPVYNVGQRVEAFTSPAWVGLMLMVHLVSPVSLEATAVLVGIACGTGGFVAAMAGSARIARRIDPGAFVLPFGILVPTSVYAFWGMASSGLETGMTYLWVGLCLLVGVIVAEGSRSRPRAWQGVVLGFGILVRPDLMIVSVVLMASLIWGRWPTWRFKGSLSFIAWGVVFPLMYQIFRMGYYGMVVANTAVAKNASSLVPGRGWHYFTNFFFRYWLIFPIAIIIGSVGVSWVRRLAASRKDRGLLSVIVGLPVAGALCMLYVVLIGGDYIHGRMLLPGLFAIIAPFAVIPVRRRYLFGSAIVPWALVSVIAVRPVFGLAGLPFITGAPSHANFAQVTSWGPNSPNQKTLRHPGVYTDNYVDFINLAQPVPGPPNPNLHLPALAVLALGNEAVAVGTKVEIIDELGLANIVGSHFPVLTNGVVPGHEKPIPVPWLIAQLTAPTDSPTLMHEIRTVMPPSSPAKNDRSYLLSDRQMVVQVAWARAALRCPAVAELVSATQAPLTLGQFWSNITHSIGNTTMRIPSDSQTAYHRYCGPGTPASVLAIQRG